MKRFYISNEEFQNRVISGEEFNHIKNVMRLKAGDSFISFNGDGFDYLTKIVSINKSSIDFEVIETLENDKNPRINLAVFQSLAKGEKMELVAQKLTEIGVSTIFPLFVKNCDVKPNTSRVSRLEKIVISACKQCGRSLIPEISEVKKLDEALKMFSEFDFVIFANEKEKDTRIYDVLEKHKEAKKVALVVGPEGGFTEDEIAEISKVATSVTLGKRILRTETAPIYISSIISDYYRN